MNYKICTKCGKQLEATTEFFSKVKKGKFGLRAICKQCGNAISRQYHNDHPEYAKTRAKKWRDNNVEYRKEYDRIHGKEYYRNNKEKCNKKAKEYYEANKEKILAYYKEWKKDNQDKRNASHAKRKAMKLNQTPDNANLQKIQLYFTICAYLNKGLDIPAWHVDHIKPISKGGLHHEDNLQVLDAKLNLQKHDKYPLTIEEEIKYKGIRI